MQHDWALGRPGVVLVEMSPALSADLRALTAALDPPGGDLERSLRGLIAAIRVNSPSYLGLTLTLVAGGSPHTIVALEPDGAGAEVRSSALVPLPLLCDVEDGSALVLYAAEVDAFVDLAVDTTVALDRPFEQIVLDQHLALPVPLPVSSITAARLENQAVGVLIDRGHSPDTAREELGHLAEASRTSLDVAAESVILSAYAHRPQCP